MQESTNYGASMLENYQIDNIPTELLPYRQWVYWIWEERGGKKPTKPPMNPQTGRYASTKDPATWGTFEEALHACQQHRGAGVGFVITDSDPIAGIDIDDCRDPETGKLSIEALEIIEALETYSEVSPSGTGIRLFFLDPGKQYHSCVNGSFEYYRSGRYLTTTGEIVNGQPSVLTDCSGAFAYIYDKYFQRSSKEIQQNEASNQDQTFIPDIFNALSYIPADNYDIWLRVGMAIHGADSSEEGLKLWDSWSRSCVEKYVPQACSQKWASFSANRTVRVTLATIYQLGKENGWKPPPPPWHNLFSKGTNGTAETTQPSPIIVFSETPQTPEVERSPYPHLVCPEHLWVGRMKEIATVMHSFTWEVWLGAITAIGAYANRHLYCVYESRPLYGNVWGLLVNYSGTGKTLCTNTCRALLPPFYRIREGVQSGPALANTLANIERDKKGTILSIEPIPALLLLEEWTRLAKNMRIPNSTLQDDLNTLFHREHPWSLTRSDYRGFSGDTEISNPSLSILGTTTPKNFRKNVTDELIYSGGVNRHIILPGSHRLDEWSYGEQDGREDYSRELRLWRAEYLPESPASFHQLWNSGDMIWHRYAHDAKERQLQWGQQFFGLFKEQETDEVELLRRLDVYSVLIPALYAFLDGSSTITLAYVEAMISAVETAAEFTRWLFAERESEIPPQQRFRSDLDQKILQKIKEQPGTTAREVASGLRRHGGYKIVIEAIYTLVELGLIIEQQSPGRQAKQLYLTGGTQ